MQKPSSCWKGSTDHWWCDVTFRCDSSWIHLKKSHRQSHKQCWGLACRRSMAKHGEAWRSGNSLSYTGKSDQLYIQLSQTSSNIIKHLSDLSVTGFLNQRLICEDTLNFWWIHWRILFGETVFPLIFDQRISDDFVGFRYFQIMLSSLMFSYVFIWSTVQLGRLALLGVPIVLSGVVRAKGPVLPPCCDVLWCVVMWESQGHKPTIYWGWYILYYTVTTPKKTDLGDGLFLGLAHYSCGSSTMIFTADDRSW